MCPQPVLLEAEQVSMLEALRRNSEEPEEAPDHSALYLKRLGEGLTGGCHGRLSGQGHGGQGQGALWAILRQAPAACAGIDLNSLGQLGAGLRAQKVDQLLRENLHFTGDRAKGPRGWGEARRAKEAWGNAGR